MGRDDDEFMDIDALVALIAFAVQSVRTQEPDRLYSREERREVRRRRIRERRRIRQEERIVERDTVQRFSIGELARLCGVTVRTLQYYDQSGLLRASFTEGGRRMYAQDDLLRLQQILFLKSLGFPLEEIGSHILKTSNSTDLTRVFMQQRDILQLQKERLQKIIDTLDIAIDEMGTGHELGIEKLMTILQLMKEDNPYNFIIRYFSDEQLKLLVERFESPAAYRSFMKDASEVFALLEELFRENIDPTGPEGQALARRWWHMVQEFSGGRVDILRTLVASSDDMENWPERAAPAKEMILQFLRPALNYYFKQHGISLDDLKQDPQE